jgi:2-methylfumaryl-CoA hydratase
MSRFNIALTGSRYALFSADSFAQDCGLPGAPIDPLLVFHTVFGKTVPDISLNAVANLGYAEGRFLAPVYPGDTLNAVSEVSGSSKTPTARPASSPCARPASIKMTKPVLSYVRWVMVNKRDAAREHRCAAEDAEASFVPAPNSCCRRGSISPNYDFALAGSPHAFEDYEIGEKIDHVDGMTVEEAEHQLATRLYQNTAKVHFDALAQKESRFGKRLIYGGVTISIARALAFNGLANAQLMLAHQWRAPRQSAVRGRYALCVVGSAGQGRFGRDRRAALAPGRGEEPSPRRLPVQERSRWRVRSNVVLDFDYWAWSGGDPEALIFAQP